METGPDWVIVVGAFALAVLMGWAGAWSVQRSRGPRGIVPAYLALALVFYVACALSGLVAWDAF